MLQMGLPILSLLLASTVAAQSSAPGPLASIGAAETTYKASALCWSKVIRGGRTSIDRRFGAFHLADRGARCGEQMQRREGELRHRSTRPAPS